MHNKHAKGFTLVEMLVVLVITALTASILATGLETTWRNFSKLDSKFLTSNSAQLPKKWFIESIEGSLLRQHNKVMFTGTENTLTHMTTKTPSGSEDGIHSCTWALVNSATEKLLSFTCGNDERIEIASLPLDSQFKYLSTQGWASEFKEQPGKLPRAIKIETPNAIWVLATVIHPTTAEIPAEIPTSGIYEF